MVGRVLESDMLQMVQGKGVSMKRGVNGGVSVNSSEAFSESELQGE